MFEYLYKQPFAPLNIATVVEVREEIIGGRGRGRGGAGIKPLTEHRPETRGKSKKGFFRGREA